MTLNWRVQKHPDLVRKNYYEFHTLSSFMQTTPGHDYVDPTSGGVAKVAVCMKGVSENNNKGFRPDQSGLDCSLPLETPVELSNRSVA